MNYYNISRATQGLVAETCKGIFCPVRRRRKTLDLHQP